MQLGAEGFEPSKAEPSDLQSDPFDHFGTRPKEFRPFSGGRIISDGHRGCNTRRDPLFWAGSPNETVRAGLREISYSW